jgi:beta-glucosidase
MRRVERFRVLAISVLLAGVPAHALAPPERRCQEAIASAGRHLVDRSMDALASCGQRVARGELPPATDCLAEPTTSGERTSAAARATTSLRTGCKFANVASLGLGGGCAGAGTLAALVACLRESHQAEAESLVAATDAPPGPLSAAARGCEVRASRQARRFAVQRLRSVQRCKRSPERVQLAPGTECAAEPRTATRIARLRAQSAARIAAACDSAELAERPFGPPCERAATGQALAECLLTAAAAAADGAVAAEYRDEGFCGEASDAVEQQIDALISQMTLEEKVDQMHGTGAFVGGIWQTPVLARLGVPGFGMTDGPRGVGTFTGPATTFPVGMARGATWDRALEERVGEAIGAEARANGASVLLAPTINILRHPRWGRAQETYGEDTVHLGRMGVGFIQGAQQHVIASAKHFAANSIEDTRFLVDVSVDERTLREVYLPHFRMAVEQAHVGSVMSAYNKVNGQYCGENYPLLHDVLKGDWGFRGFVESDWVFGTHSTEPSAIAGLDIEMPVNIYFGAPLVAAVTAGDIPMAVIDTAVRRILRAKLCFRLDTEPPVLDPDQVETQAHLDLALEVAREGIVLLKNVGAALPLERSQVGSIVVVGDLAAVANLGDHGSSSVTPSFAVTPLDGILAGAGGVPVTHVAGPPLSPGDQAAVAAAGAVVVVAGLTFADEGEGLVAAGDRDGLGLSAAQEAMIGAVAALNSRTIVVLEGGSAIAMPWVADVPAILMAWYPGQLGGNAIADVLFGDVNPSGKLPITFPVAEADLPPFDNVSLAVTYDYYHGYRHLDRNGTDPLFPFGFGLSYTTFQYSNLALARSTVHPRGRIRATVDVTNTGAVAGDEIAQLYVGALGSGVDRAVKELKAFARVHLEPGETRTVPFEVPAADLAFWDVAASRWEIEPISYRVRVGASSRDLPLEATFAVTAGDPP